MLARTSSFSTHALQRQKERERETHKLTPHFFLFHTRVATASDGNVDLTVAAHDYCAGQMPATILVAQAVVGKGCKHFGLAGGCTLTGFETVAHQTIGEGKIEPAPSILVCVKGDTVWIS